MVSALWADWSRVQVKEYFADPSEASIALTLDNTTQSGSLIIVGLYVSANDTSESCGDSAGGTYTALYEAPLYNATYGSSLQLFYRENVGAVSSLVITCSFTGQFQYRGIVVSEFSGAATSNALGQKSQTTESQASTATNGAPLTAVTTTTSNELVVGLIGQLYPWSATITAGSGFTLSGLALEWQVKASAGAITPAFTFSAADYYQGLVATFKASSGAPAAQRRRGVTVEE